MCIFIFSFIVHLCVDVGTCSPDIWGQITVRGGLAGSFRDTLCDCGS